MEQIASLRFNKSNNKEEEDSSRILPSKKAPSELWQLTVGDFITIKLVPKEVCLKFCIILINNLLNK